MIQKPLNSTAISSSKLLDVNHRLSILLDDMDEKEKEVAISMLEKLLEDFQAGKQLSPQYLALEISSLAELS